MIKPAHKWVTDAVSIGKPAVFMASLGNPRCHSDRYIK